MDKLLNSPLFVKIISLTLAVMLYLTVSMDSPANNNDSSALPSLNDDEESVLDIPLKAEYDEGKYIVSGLPQNVSISLSGPTGTITTVKLQRAYEAYVNLEGLKPGTHRVKVQYRNISDKLKVKINPSVVTVTIQEKVSEVVPVEVEYINKTKIQDGYSAEEPIISPNSVRVTGAKEEIGKIALVKALVDLKGVKETITKAAPVKVYDQDGNELKVVVEPSVVEVKVPITSPYKTVPFKINRKGELPDGLSINSIEVSPSEISIYGPKERINAIEFIDDVVVDLSEITKDTTLEVDIPVPDGVEKVDPQKVKISIDVEKTEKKTFENVLVSVVGLADGLSATFVNEEERRTNLDIFGTAQVLQDIQMNDVDVYVDLSTYSRGIHDVDIEVNGPQNITWKLGLAKAKIEIK